MGMRNLPAISREKLAEQMAEQLRRLLWTFGEGVICWEPQIGNNPFAIGVASIDGNKVSLKLESATTEATAVVSFVVNVEQYMQFECGPEEEE